MRPGRIDTSALFEQVFSIYRDRAAVLLPAAALLYIAPTLLRLTRGTTGQALALAATLIAGIWFQGLAVQAVRATHEGVRELSIGRLFASVSDVFAPLLWTAILILVGVFLGFLAFFIPGLILMTQWAVAAPVVVMEDRKPTEAIARSGQLVRGHGWQVFSLLIVTILITLIVVAAVVSLAAAVSDARGVLAVVDLIATVVSTPILALMVAVLYLELLKLKGEPLPRPRAGAVS